jgi:hypothetical protein
MLLFPLPLSLRNVAQVVGEVVSFVATGVVVSHFSNDFKHVNFGTSKIIKPNPIKTCLKCQRIEQKNDENLTYLAYNHQTFTLMSSMSTSCVSIPKDYSDQ